MATVINSSSYSFQLRFLKRCTVQERFIVSAHKPQEPGWSQGNHCNEFLLSSWNINSFMCSISDNGLLQIERWSRFKRLGSTRSKNLNMLLFPTEKSSFLFNGRHSLVEPWLCTVMGEVQSSGSWQKSPSFWGGGCGKKRGKSNS